MYIINALNLIQFDSCYCAVSDISFCIITYNTNSKYYIMIFLYLFQHLSCSEDVRRTTHFSACCILHVSHHALFQGCSIVQRSKDQVTTWQTYQRCRRWTGAVCRTAVDVPSDQQPNSDTYSCCSQREQTVGNGDVQQTRP